MRASTVILGALAVATPALAKTYTVADFPYCSTKCAFAAAGPDTCEISDYACTCKSVKYQAAVEACMRKPGACSSDEITTSNEVSAGICVQNGITQKPTLPPASSTPAATGTSSTKSMTTTAKPVGPPGIIHGNGTHANGTIVSPTMAATATATATDVSTGDADLRAKVGMGLLAMMGLAAAL